MANNVIVKVGARQADPALYANAEGTLVLCSLTSSPTIVNGGMYYDTTLIKGRLCVNNVWRNLIVEGVPVGDYIQNQNSIDQTANGRISGSFKAVKLIAGSTSTANYALEVQTNNGGMIPVTTNGFAFGWNRSGSNGESNLIWCSNAANKWLAIEFFDGTTVVEQARMLTSGRLLLKDNVSIGTPLATAAPIYGLEITGGTAGYGLRTTNGIGFMYNDFGQGESNISWASSTGAWLSFSYSVGNGSGRTEVGRWLSNGNLLVGSTSNNGAKLQINGGALSLAPNASDFTGVNGALFYRSDTNKFRGYVNGVWKNLATEDNAFLTGRTVRVENTHPFATDTRTGISKYSQSVPFATIAAANAALVAGDNLYICNGTYNESVSFPNILTQVVFIENSTINGGASWALGATNNYTVIVHMRNTLLTATGNSGDLTNTATIFCNVGRIHLLGLDDSCNVTNTNGVAYAEISNSAKTFENIRFSAPISCFYAQFSNAVPNVFKECTFISTAGPAINVMYNCEYYNCYIKGTTAAIAFGGNTRLQGIIDNCYLEATTGDTINGGTMGADSVGVFVVKNSTLIGSTSILNFASGNAAFYWGCDFTNNIIRVTSGTSAIIPAGTTHVSSFLRVTSNTSNVTIFSDAIKASSTFIAGYYRETSTNQGVQNTSLVSGTSLSLYNKQVHTTGATVTMRDGIRVLYVNPASLLANLTITLPAAPLDGQEVLIEFGGTITTGTVVTTLSVVANAGQTLIGGASITTATVGGGIHVKYESSTTIWRILTNQASSSGLFIQNQNASFQTATYLVTSTGITAQIQTSSATNPAIIVRNTNTSGSAKLVATDNGGGERVHFGYGNSAFGTTLLQSKGFVMTNGDEIVLTTDNGTSRGLTIDSLNNTRVSKGFIADGVQIHTAGATVTMNDSIRALYVDPAALLSPLAITMPANPRDGQEVMISFGGTITSGSVVTELSIVGNTGHTILKGASITAAQAGDGYVFKFQSSTNKWRIF